MVKKVGFVLTVVFCMIGLMFFNYSFSQTDIQILSEITKIDKSGFVSKMLLFYMFARFFTNILVEITAPFRTKIAEFIIAWFDKKINNLKTEK